jgi:class 3 adenylate cyclase
MKRKSFHLSKFFDPFIYKKLKDLTIAEITDTYLTIAFWDISNFSLLCKELKNDETLIQFLLNNYYDTASYIIKKNNGILDKFIGDGIMAYFGYVDNNNIAGTINAIKTAFELKKEFEKIYVDFLKTCSEFYVKIKTKVYLKGGISAGNVLFGYWESQYRSQITAIGNEVNFANRLVNLQKDGSEIIVSKQLRNNCSTLLNDNKLDLEGKTIIFEELDVKGRIKSHEEVDKVFIIKQLPSSFL